MSGSIDPRSLGLKFSHMGVCAEDLPRMERFYTDVLGFTVTDRGHQLNFDLVFLSRDPKCHHQIVLSTGRPRGLPPNTANPMFGPVINQISLQMDDLAGLRQWDAHLKRAYPEGERIYANHGNAWSVYVPDPEGNLIEVYVDSPWFCHQPMFEPLDLAEPDEVILAKTEALCRADPEFKPAQAWREEMAPVMAGRTAVPSA